ncbi:hypothetical protein F2Q69_00021945 [Brassica cretica]|uniref:Uncharacterized protein n=1 Tax=Brassica cretica TaxID=69181 RepID=A0A8S9QLV9_BRACR|nr:hypothetical protein F2Q69_00021945 [Brassica cretica]
MVEPKTENQRLRHKLTSRFSFFSTLTTPRSVSDSYSIHCLMTNFTAVATASASPSFPGIRS